MKMSFNITLRMLQRQRRHITRFDTAVAACKRGGGVKTTCCKSYQRKGKACKKCPVMAHLDPKALKHGRKHKK